jgi:succinate dehydrogenase / fumarate reductase flavoprotein subunit
MQGLADGYFVLPYTIGNYLATVKPGGLATDHAEIRKAQAEVEARLQRLLAVGGKRTVRSFHRQLGRLLWDDCGMARNDAGLRRALEAIPAIRAEFWQNVNVLGSGEELNQALEHAGRVADYLEFAELMCLDALERRESCGGHFREEFQTGDGEAKRDDANFCHVSAWEYAGPDRAPVQHREPLHFESVHLTQRSYK